MVEIRRKKSASNACRLLLILAIPVLVSNSSQAYAAPVKGHGKPSPTVADKSASNAAQAKAREILTSIATSHETRQHFPPTGRIDFQEQMRRGEESRTKLTSLESQLELLGPSIAPFLAENLNNSDTDVCGVCSRVLSTFGPTVVPLIIANYHLKSKVQFFATALNSASAEALQAVLGMLESENADKRGLGVSLIGSLLGHSNPNAFPSYRFRLVRIGGSIKSAHLRNGPPVSESFQKSICQITSAEKITSLRASLCAILGDFGTGIPAVTTTLTNLSTKDLEPTVRLEAIASLGNIVALSNDKSIEATLRNRILEDASEECRAASIAALSMEDNPSPANLEALKTAFADRSELVSAASLSAVRALGLRARPLAPDLIKIINDNSDQRLAANATMALAEMQSPKENELELFEQLLERPNPQIQTSALKGLGQMHEAAQPAVPKIIPFLTRTNSFATREAITALKEIGPGASAAEDALKALLNDRSNNWAAREALKIIDPSYNPPPREVHRPISTAPPPPTGGPSSVIPTPPTNPVSK